MPTNLDGVIGFVITLGALLWLQRAIHNELQLVLFLFTRRVELTMVVFSLLLFPGVILHELSHFLMAKLLGVPTGGFSVLPRAKENGRLQMGYVETASTDWFRDALIGLAPLLAGGGFVGYVGLIHLQLQTIWGSLAAGDLNNLLQMWKAVFALPDFWIWFYLVFAVSSTMIPSSSDRRAWLPVSLLIIVVVCLSWLAGAGPWLRENLAGVLNQWLGVVALVFGISVLVHSVLYPALWVLRKLLAKLSPIPPARV